MSHDLLARSTDLVTRYNASFTAVLADTAPLIRAALSLRYQVYCLERHFEEPDPQSGGIEHDDYDPRSMPGLLYFRPMPEPIGTARLILPVAHGKSLPMHHLLTASGVRTSQHFPDQTTAEVSRFSISKEFRRRASDSMSAVGLRPSQIAELYTAMPCLGLVQTMLRASVNNGITHWTAIMEPKLLRMLATLGIHFHSIGPLVSHHGLRQPSFCSLVEMLQMLGREKPQHWNIVTDNGELLPSEYLGRRSAA